MGSQRVGQDWVPKHTCTLVPSFMCLWEVEWTVIYLNLVNLDLDSTCLINREVDKTESVSANPCKSHPKGYFLPMTYFPWHRVLLFCSQASARNKIICTWKKILPKFWNNLHVTSSISFLWLLLAKLETFIQSMIYLWENNAPLFLFVSH